MPGTGSVEPDFSSRAASSGVPGAPGASGGGSPRDDGEPRVVSTDLVQFKETPQQGFGELGDSDVSSELWDGDEEEDHRPMNR
mmetsp:Transcript_32103/g.106258  ORF Transcript_32103/g.106258 Transcript_32103/m.106258 type:complete len:83 (+) Transcript_32103:98-346(+)